MVRLKGSCALARGKGLYFFLTFFFFEKLSTLYRQEDPFGLILRQG
jgi:hypothetical protein